jgi:hypothetical protein
MVILPISKIRTDGGTQPRASIDFEAVDDYTDAMRAGAKFPPLTVFYDGVIHWLADGFHRLRAAFAAELLEIACDVQQGTQQDAQWYSFAANKTNGLRRTNEDKQRAVKAALAHPGGVGKSDSAIAKHVGVSAPTVAAWREKTHPSIKSLEIAERTVTRNGSTYQQNTANIGRKPVGIRQSEPKLEAALPDRAPSIRQRQIENKNKERLIAGLSAAKGLKYMDEKLLSSARAALTAEEAHAFADIADESSERLRAIARALRGGRPAKRE